MPIINLLNQMALTKSLDQNSSNLINMYLVEAQDQDKYQQVAYPTPGVTLFSSGSSVIRALLTVHNITYGLDGNQFFSVDSSGIRTNIGTINSSTGWAKIRAIRDQIFIADNTSGYNYKITANTFAQITSTTYVSSVVITAAGSGYISPTAIFSDSTGTGAEGTVVVVGGQITAVNITANGSNYTSPTVSFSDVVGGGINATANVNTTTTSFPTTIQDIECQDEFGLVLQQNSQTWNASAVSDLTTWPTLSFASTTGNQNFNKAIVSCHRELYILGNQTSEIWDNLGTVNFTFGRNNSAFIEYGCAAISSVAKADNTFFFLAQSPTGANIIMRMNGYSPVKISTRAIDYQISTYTTVADAFAFAYQQEGHEFYVLTFPTMGVTWVYDISTQVWHQRQSLISSNQTNWLASCYTFNYNKCLIGDLNSGNIYQLDMTNNTENNVAITRTFISHPFYNAGSWVYIDKLQIDFDNGPGLNLSNWNLYISRDGGRTFGTAKPAQVSQDANGMYRVYWNRLGYSKTFVIKLETNANIKPIILGAWANVRAGDNT